MAKYGIAPRNRGGALTVTPPPAAAKPWMSSNVPQKSGNGVLAKPVAAAVRQRGTALPPPPPQIASGKSAIGKIGPIKSMFGKKGK